MGSNPMQKMKRNSTLTGAVIGLLIGLALCAALYFYLTKNGGSVANSKDGKVSVCVLNKTIKAGTKITQSDITIKPISKTGAPADITTAVLDSTAKIDLSLGTIITTGMINANTETISNDTREQEYNMLSLPTQLQKDDFIDIRLQLSNGGDYVVVSKKQVLNCNSSTIWLNMNEEEISIMSNAIIEYYTMKGSKLYVTKYIEPGLQTASIGTYVPNKTVSELISANPNIKNLINAERYSDALKGVRNNNINSELGRYSEKSLDNIEEKIQEEIKTLKESREAYFGTLNSAN